MYSLLCYKGNMGLDTIIDMMMLLVEKNLVDKLKSSSYHNCCFSSCCLIIHIVLRIIGNAVCSCCIIVIEPSGGDIGPKVASNHSHQCCYNFSFGHWCFGIEFSICSSHNIHRTCSNNWWDKIGICSVNITKSAIDIMASLSFLSKHKNHNKSCHCFSCDCTIRVVSRYCIVHGKSTFMHSFDNIFHMWRFRFVSAIWEWNFCGS